jgi:hypothetical protein
MRRRRERFAVLVVWLNGQQEFLHPGLSTTAIATFRSKFEAQEMADFLLQGIEHEIQAIVVVPAPERRPAA